MIPIPLMIGAAALLLLRKQAGATIAQKTVQPIKVGNAPVLYRTPTDVAGELARQVAAQIFRVGSPATAQAAAAAIDNQRESGANAVKWGDPYYSSAAIDRTSYAAGSGASTVEAIQYADAFASAPVYQPAEDLQVADYVTGQWGGVW